MNLPVLIYISKEGCPACSHFDAEWGKIKNNLSGKARFVKFVTTANLGPPPALLKYSGWFPSVVLAGPKSYFRVFTDDDKINDIDYDGNYVIKAKKFNAAEENGTFVFGGRPNTANSVETWFSQVSPTVREYDEKTPPKRYPQMF